jgi:general secretion pathway protein K
MWGAAARSATAARQRGIVLVVVLWTVTLLALQVSLFNLTVRDAASLAGNELASARGEELAAAGVELAAARLTEREPNRRWLGNGSMQTVELGGAELLITITDETSRIDINEADAELLASMLRPFAKSPAVLAEWVDRIIDWRDPDDARRPQGAEEIDYRRAGVGYLPRNGPFLHVTELARVLGIPAAVTESLAPFLTVYSGEAKINPNIAARQVLLMLPGADPVEIDRALSPAAGGRGAGAAGLAGLNRWFTTRNGPTYRVEVVVRGGQDAAVMASVEAVILVGRDAASPFRVLSWRQGARTREGQ